MHKPDAAIFPLPPQPRAANRRDGGGPRTGPKGKANYVTLLGVDAARERLGLLGAQTKAHLDPFGERAIYLRDSVDFVLDRSA